MNAELAMLAAMADGRNVWATVFRGGMVRMVRGQDVKQGEILSWTFEGGKRWITVARISWERIGDADVYLSRD